MNFQFQLRDYKKKNGTQAIRLRFFTSANDIQYYRYWSVRCKKPMG